MNLSLQPISFKDPSGHVIQKEDGYYRYVSHQYAPEYEHLMHSGLYKTLTDASLMIQHQEIEEKEAGNNYYKVLFPQQLELMTYPYEWVFSQCQEMALALIRINQVALQYGMILKDATPYNFVFVEGKCMLLDSLSFRFFKDGDPWLAYRQYCEEILGPLALMRYNDPCWARLQQASLRGLPLAFISQQLPLKTWFNTACLLHIHLHVKFQNRKENAKQSHAGFSQQKLNILWDLLQKNITKWERPLNVHSIWDQYYENDIEDENYLADKTAFVSQWLAETNPDTTIDLGANTGKFSFMAAQYSKQVIAVENDWNCVEQIRTEGKQKKINNISTLVADITEPSPALGWANAEKTALLQRLNGNMVLALALIHHLCLSKNIPLDFIAETIAGITTKYAIVEFVSKDDSKAKSLLQHREDIFEEYTEVNFIKSFQTYFNLVDTHGFTRSARKLFLWEKN